MDSSFYIQVREMKAVLEPFFVPIKEHSDPRGLLGVVEDQELPFTIRRVFWLSEVPENTMRGGHAHHRSQQILICVKGSIKAHLEDIKGQQFEFRLQSQSQGLFLPPLFWGSFEFGSDTQAIALASDYFDEADYIRNYQDFKKLQHDYQGA